MKAQTREILSALETTLAEIKNHVESAEISDQGAPDMEVASELAVASGYVHGCLARFRALLEARGNEE